MPWLQRGEVLFVHVPRCGGTSITKHHRVGQKAQDENNIFVKFGIMYYYYRYKLLEKSNFPVVTYENLIAVIQFTVAFLFFFYANGLPVPYIMWPTSCLLFINSTFVWTAPIAMRVDLIRNLLMFFQGTCLCGVMADTKYLIGTNPKGVLLHLTAERIIRYGYVSEEEVKRKSFSIVRNPFSRAVSMYEYNKRMGESFPHFIKAFYDIGKKRYIQKGQTDSKHIYCHVLPMHAYTHIDGKQVVNTIIKQEQLKRLVATCWADSGVPIAIQNALTGIPHANSRKRKMRWEEYYTQETMEMVVDLYRKDFEIFGYDLNIPNRPDLKVTVPVTSTASVPVAASVPETLPRYSVPDALTRHDSERLHVDNDPKQDPNMARVKDQRRVSVSEKVVTSYYNEDKAPTNGKILHAGDIELTLTSAEEGRARNLTSAGEETSEFGAHTELKTWRTVSVGLEGEDGALLLRKKRAASAFVLHVN